VDGGAEPRSIALGPLLSAAAASKQQHINTRASMAIALMGFAVAK